MKKKISRFLSSLRANELITNLEIYTGEDDGYWVYYFDITGFLEGKYFNISIRNKYTHTCEIVNTTVCKEEIKEMINKFNIN